MNDRRNVIVGQKVCRWYNGRYTVWAEIFAGQNFRGLAAGKDLAKIFSRFDDHKILRLKFSRSEANPRKPRKFCPAKISRHTAPYGEKF